eukprot:SAG31_NODE_347_length_17310_cov_3.764743_9_plen_1165_part_00
MRIRVGLLLLLLLLLLDSTLSSTATTTRWEVASSGNLSVMLHSPREHGLMVALNTEDDDDQPIFKAGKGSPRLLGVGNYSCYMNPAAIALRRTENKGTVLLFTEARWPSCNDFFCRDGVCGRHDIALRRSTDNGNTFGDMQLVVQVDRDWKNANDSTFNIAPVEDVSTGKVLVLYNRQPAFYNTRARMYNPRARETFVSESTDSGITWSSPRNITAQLVGGKNPHWTNTRNPTAVTPGPGIQLMNGRLLVPGYGCPLPADGTCVTYSLQSTLRSWALISDDGGDNFHLGEASPVVGSAEPMAVELSNGGILMNMRSVKWKHDNKPHPDRYRQYTLSTDQGETFGIVPPGKYEKLVGPSCQASFIRAGNTLLFANPANQMQRLNMTLRVSHDEAKTWEQSMLVYPNSSWYSSIVCVPASASHCLNALLFFAKDCSSVIEAELTAEAPNICKSVSLYRTGLTGHNPGETSLKTDDDSSDQSQDETLLGSYGYWLTGSQKAPVTVSDVNATISAFQRNGQTLMGVPVDECHYWALLRPALEATAHTQIKVFGVLGSHNGPIYCPAVWGTAPDGKPIASGVDLNWTHVSTTLATISIEFPHFIGYTIDDFYCMMQDPLNPSNSEKVTVAVMADAHASMKAIAPSFVFMPTVYPPFMGTFAAEKGFTLGVGPEIPFDEKTTASVSFHLENAACDDDSSSSVAFWISSPFVTWGNREMLPSPVWRNKVFVRCVIHRTGDKEGTLLLDLDLYDLASCPPDSSTTRQCMPRLMALMNVSLPTGNQNWRTLTVEIYARDEVNLNFYASKLVSLWDVSLLIDGHEQIDHLRVQFHAVDSPTAVYNNVSNVGKVTAHANTNYSIAWACDGLLFPTPMSVLELTPTLYKSLLQHAVGATQSRGLSLWMDHYQWMWPGVFGKSVANAEPAFLKWMVETDREAAGVAAVVFCGLRMEVSNLPSQRGIFTQRQAPSSSRRVASIQNWTGVVQAWFPGYAPGYGGWFQSWTSRQPLQLASGVLTIGVSRGRAIPIATNSNPWFFSAIIRELDGPVLFNVSADAAPLASNGSLPCPGMERAAAAAVGLNCTVRYPQTLQSTDFPEVVHLQAQQPLQLVLEMSELQGVGNHPSGVMFATSSAVDEESVWHYASGIRDAKMLESYQAVVSSFASNASPDFGFL